MKCILLPIVPLPSDMLRRACQVLISYTQKPLLAQGSEIFSVSVFLP